MNALSKPIPQARPAAPPRQIHAGRRQKTQAVEAALVVGLNGLLIGVGLYTLFQLVPHQLAQHRKLQALRSETEAAAARVQQLESSHQESLKARESRRIAEDQGYLVGEKKVRLNWQR